MRQWPSPPRDEGLALPISSQTDPMGDTRHLTRGVMPFAGDGGINTAIGCDRDGINATRVIT
ncbi:hypothetical protein EBZ35_05855 [bacterium]|nr:hypothetical protein [bacterium]